LVTGSILTGNDRGAAVDDPRAGRYAPDVHRVVVAALLLVTACSGGSPSSTPTPTATLPPGVRAVHLGGTPCGIAEAAGAAWVTDAATATLYRVDPTTLQARKAAALDATPCELTAAFGALWVATQSGYLDRVDPGTGEVRRTRVGATSYEVEPAAGALWVSDRDSAQLTRVDPTTLATTRLPLPGTHPGGLTYAFGSLWVGDDSSDATQLLRVDPVRRTVTRVRADRRPAYTTATRDAVWVSDQAAGAVTRVDPRTLAARTSPVGVSPVNLDVVGDRVWVPDDQADAVYQLDARGAVARTVAAAGGGPAVVAPVAGQAWVSLYKSGDVWAIR
jgi:streptogramin lyase